MKFYRGFPGSLLEASPGSFQRLPLEVPRGFLWKSVCTGFLLEVCLSFFWQSPEASHGSLQMLPL